jgi:hypothetical protein
MSFGNDLRAKTRAARTEELEHAKKALAEMLPGLKDDMTAAAVQGEKFYCACFESAIVMALHEWAMDNGMQGVESWPISWEKYKVEFTWEK